jgi:hypothetical protein
MYVLFSKCEITVVGMLIILHIDKVSIIAVFSSLFHTLIPETFKEYRTDESLDCVLPKKCAMSVSGACVM